MYTVFWTHEQTARFVLSAGFVPARAGRTRPHRHAYPLSGPGGCAVAVHQARVDDWEIAALFGASAAAPYGPDSGPADSQAREQARWTRDIVWTDSLAGALAVARAAAYLGFQGPHVRKEQRWLALAKWAARHSGAAAAAMSEPSRRATWTKWGTSALGGGGNFSRAGCDTPHREAPTPWHALLGGGIGCPPLARRGTTTAAAVVGLEKQHEFATETVRFVQLRSGLHVFTVFTPRHEIAESGLA